MGFCGMSGGGSETQEARRGRGLKDKMLPCGGKMALLTTRQRKGTFKFVKPSRWSLAAGNLDDPAPLRNDDDEVQDWRLEIAGRFCFSYAR